MTGFAPTPAHQRDVVIDQLRGLAVLGLTFMLATAYGLQHAAFYRLEVDSDASLDWVAAGVGFVAFDLKASALVMLVLGAGIAQLMDRAEAHGRRPKRFLRWRAFLLVLIGVQPGVHAPLWEGNYHLFAAVFSLVAIAMYRRSAKAQFVVGTVLVLAALAITPAFQATFPADGLGLGQYWWPDTHPFYRPLPEPDVHPTGYFIVTLPLRLAGTMLIGMALFRWGILQGHRPRAFYRRLAVAGFGVGLPLSVASLVWMHTANYRPSVALIGHVPNAAAAIPVALGVLSLIVLWNDGTGNGDGDGEGEGEGAGGSERAQAALAAVGRMALTNSALVVVIGTAVLREGFGRNFFSRAELALIAVAVVALQLAWSGPWLARFRYGPLEWLLRMATYRRGLPMRHEQPS